jgi:hypothetical protein
MGTHGLQSSDYKVIGFGGDHLGSDGITGFYPLACYALATGKLELVSLLLLHYLKCLALDFFGLTPHFKGGIISDHTGRCEHLPRNIPQRPGMIKAIFVASVSPIGCRSSSSLLAAEQFPAYMSSTRATYYYVWRMCEVMALGQNFK